MSKHQEWKMLHLLYTYARRTGTGDRRVLTEQELTNAGVHCDPDSRQVLEDAGVVTRIGKEYELSEPARKILSTFTIAQGPRDSIDIRVDYPEGIRGDAIFGRQPAVARNRRPAAGARHPCGPSRAGTLSACTILRKNIAVTTRWRSV
jgi:hypothetical protein